MSDYTPPLRDIKFVLEHIADLEALSSLPEFAHAETDVTFAALDEAGRFFADVVAPTNRTGDTVGSVRNDDGTVTTPPGFKDAYARYVAAGWGAVKGPMEHGGYQFPGVVGSAVMEMLTSANMAFSLCPMLTASSILALRRHGTEDQRATYLPKLLTGEWSGTMLLTESQAGSDLGAVTTQAIPLQDGTWAITGQKIFITWGEHDMVDNIIHMVLARVPGGPPGTKGVSMFIVPKMLVGADGATASRNSVECLSIEHKLGINASPTCVMALEDATGYLVGEVHEGMRYMFTMMNDARLHVGLESLAVSVRAYEAALAFAAERRQGRTIGGTDSAPIIEHPDVRRMLMTMKASIEAMRGVMYDNAAAIDRAEADPDESARETAAARAALLTPLSKAWGSDLGVELASLALQVHGGMGYVEETGIAQHYRDVRIAPIYEGTNGIQAIDLALRKLPMDGGSVVRGFLDEIEQLANDLDDNGKTPPVIAAALRTGVVAVRAASDHLLARTDVADVLAGASPYLRMFGTLAGGYELARLALAAQTSGNGDAWHAAKISTAAFYAGQILPQIAGLLPAVRADASALFAIDADHLDP